MNEAELLGLYLDVNQDIDTQFQVWISITFGILVASFVAEDRLNRMERVILALFYASAALILLLRYQGALVMAESVLRMFDANGLDRPFVQRAAATLRLLLFTFGSLTVSLSVLFPRVGRARLRGGEDS